MTETEHVSIDEVRALVGERQRYDDWLSALESRRAETPERVFERVHGDYLARRRDVLARLREHVGGLSSTTSDLESRLSALDVRLGALEDERAEAMLRTAVGEYDSERWERVRQDVEQQIAELGSERTAVVTELDEVRSLLSSASSEPEPEPDNTPTPDEAQEPSIGAAVEAEPLTSASLTTDAAVEVTELEADPSTTADWPVASPSADVWSGVDEALPVVNSTLPVSAVDAAPAIASELATNATSDLTTDGELADLDNALALFSSEGTPDGFSAGSGSGGGAVGSSSPTGLPTALDGVDVFDDAELGDLRMVPPARSTATVTPPASPVNGMNAAAPVVNDSTRDGFDDLAFLRSVVDAGAPTGAVRGPASGEQQKTLRCTECGTMNLPTEWYCERCGGELAAF